MIEYAKDVYSQNGEDGVIEELLNRIKDVPKYFVEFGGWDGFHLSNVANLRENKGWDGVMFELDGGRVEQNTNENIKLYSEAITSKNVNDVFNKYKVPSRFGVLSIDIDGDDWFVWNKLNKKYKPDIVVIEYNYFLDNSVPLVYKEQGLNQTKENVHLNYFNSNLLAMAKLGESKGYKIACVVFCNIIFVRNELFNKLGIEYVTPVEAVLKYETPDLKDARELKTGIIINLEWEMK